MEVTQLIHLLEVFEKSCGHSRNTLKTQLHFVQMKHRTGVKMWGKLGIVPKLWKTTDDFSSNVYPVSSPQGGLARGHLFMSDLYVPFLEAGAEFCPSPGNLDSRRPSGNEHLQTLPLPPNRQSCTQDQKTSQDPGIPVVITRRVISGLSHKAGSFCSGLFFHLDESSTF